MFACKYIFATSSIDMAVLKKPREPKGDGILQSKIPYMSIIMYILKKSNQN